MYTQLKLITNLYVYSIKITQISTHIIASMLNISAHIHVLSHYFYECIISHIFVSIPKYNYKYN